MKGSRVEGTSGDGPSPPPRREAVLDEVFELQMSLMWLSQHAMRELMNRFELQPPHFMVLNLLGGIHPELAQPAEGGLSMSEVSRSLSLPPASATALIDRLAARWLVERRPSPQDRRVVMVGLTGEGRAVTAALHQGWRQIQREAFEVIPDSELRAHLALMRRLQQSYLDRSPPTETGSPPAEPTLPPGPTEEQTR